MVRSHWELGLYGGEWCHIVVTVAAGWHHGVLLLGSRWYDIVQVRSTTQGGVLRGRYPVCVARGQSAGRKHTGCVEQCTIPTVKQAAGGTPLATFYVLICCMRQRMGRTSTR